MKFILVTFTLVSLVLYFSFNLANKGKKYVGHTLHCMEAGWLITWYSMEMGTFARCSSGEFL